MYITICMKNRKEILSKIEIYNTGCNRDKLINVGADASVRLEKNQNKNNIKIFEKFKSDVVGVGVPDDPQTKYRIINKLMSNEISKYYSTFF